VKCEDDTPKDDVGREIFGNGYALDDPVGRILDKQYSNVDTGRQPGELLRDQHIVSGTGIWQELTLSPTRFKSSLIPMMLVKLMVPLSSAWRK
jgi:hypothetical protein